MKYTPILLYFFCALLQAVPVASADGKKSDNVEEYCRSEACFERRDAPFEVFIECKLGKDEEQTFRILRHGKYIYTYYKQFGASEPILFKENNITRRDANDDDVLFSSLEYMDAACAGNGEKIFTAFYPPPAGKHVFNYFLRYNSATKKWQEIEVNAHDVPERIYVNEKDFMVLVKNHPMDRKDEESIYDLYDHKGKFIEQLRKHPPNNGYTVIIPKMTHESYEPEKKSRW